MIAFDIAIQMPFSFHGLLTFFLRPLIVTQTCMIKNSHFLRITREAYVTQIVQRMPPCASLLGRSK